MLVNFLILAVHDRAFPPSQNKGHRLPRPRLPLQKRTLPPPTLIPPPIPPSSRTRGPFFAVKKPFWRLSFPLHDGKDVLRRRGPRTFPGRPILPFLPPLPPPQTTGKTFIEPCLEELPFFSPGRPSSRQHRAARLPFPKVPRVNTPLRSSLLSQIDYFFRLPPRIESLLCCTGLHSPQLTRKIRVPLQAFFLPPLPPLLSGPNLFCRRSRLHLDSPTDAGLLFVFIAFFFANSLLSEFLPF